MFSSLSCPCTFVRCFLVIFVNLRWKPDSFLPEHRFFCCCFSFYCFLTQKAGMNFGFFFFFFFFLKANIQNPSTPEVLNEEFKSRVVSCAHSASEARWKTLNKWLEFRLISCVANTHTENESPRSILMYVLLLWAFYQSEAVKQHRCDLNPSLICSRDTRFNEERCRVFLLCRENLLEPFVTSSTLKNKVIILRVTFYLERKSLEIYLQSLRHVSDNMDKCIKIWSLLFMEGNF